MKAGGWQNSLLPVYSALAMMLALAAYNFSADVKPQASPDLSRFVWMAVVIQLAGLLYNPSARIPTVADEQAGRDLIAQISVFKGEVLLFSHGYLPLMAGKEPNANCMAVTGVLSGGGALAREMLLSDVKRALSEKRFAAIVLDAPDDLDFAADEFAASYRLERRVFDDPQVFWPVSGYPTRPQEIYVPRSE